MDDKILVTPEKPDAERDAVARAWVEAGGTVLRLDRFWEPPPLPADAVRLYGPDTFCLVLAQLLGLRLVSPADDLLADAPSELLGRRVRVARLDSASENLPAFVKPLVPKAFRASVYRDAQELRAETRGLPAETPVLLSEVIHFRAEARAFLLGSDVLDCAVYEGTASAADASAFASQVASVLPLPTTTVLDVGYSDAAGWALVEANAPWGSGLNGCRAKAVVPSIVRATEVWQPRAI